MKSCFRWTRAAVIVAVLALGADAAAQQAGLVNVNISDIRIDLADLLDVDVSQVPVTVQAPIGVAANVCNVAVNALVADLVENGTADCTAEESSTAIASIVQRQIG